MKGLGLRLTLSLGAAALMGLSVANVAFVLWATRHVAETRRITLYAATSQVLQHLDRPDWVNRMHEWAAEHDVVLSVRDGKGYAVSTTPIALPPTVPPQGFTQFQGADHVATLLPERAGGWRELWVSRRADAVWPALWELQRQAFLWLLLAGAVTVAAGMLFLRRAVLQPLQHITDLLFAGDAAALQRVGTDPRQGMGALGQAVIGMAHLVEEDRQRIANQLDDLRAAHGALERAQSQLVRAERLAVVGKLAAGLAHEIGNPLAVVQGFVELLGDATLPPDQRQQAGARVEHELHRIQKTVRQLLDFSRAPRTVAHVGDVGEALTQLQMMLAPQERWRAIRLLLPKVEGPLPVRVDTDALVQVLLNLFFNAADALGNQGTFRVALRHLEGGSIALDVEDSGPGIPEAIAEHVFEPFFTTKPAGVGTGLGLAVCEGILTAAGGDISVGRSATLGGARFILVLPPP